MKKIGVIFGGKSVEHDISIITGLQIIKFLKKYYNCLPIYINREGRWLTAKNIQNVEIYRDFDKCARGVKEIFPCFGKGRIMVGRRQIELESCFNCCHGLNGEDGSVASVLELSEIPYSSSGLESSSLSMDKVLTKILLSYKGIKNTKFSYINRKDLEEEGENFLKEVVNEIGFPLIVKPANLGSSVGIGVCQNYDEFNNAMEVALNFDNRILVEEFLENAREFNCACFSYNGKIYVSKVSEVDKGEFYTFEEKYIQERKHEKKDIDEKIISSIKELTKQVYKMTDCFGIVRIDFLYYHDEIYVNEINSIPGALSCYLFEEDFGEILDLIILESKERLKQKERISFSYKSDALKVFEEISESFKLKK